MVPTLFKANISRPPGNYKLHFRLCDSRVEGHLANLMHLVSSRLVKILHTVNDYNNPRVSLNFTLSYQLVTGRAYSYGQWSRSLLDE